MANNAKAAILDAVSEMAVTLDASWDGSLNWGMVSSALVDLIIELNDALNADQLTILMGSAAMAHRQAMRAEIDGLMMEDGDV